MMGRNAEGYPDPTAGKAIRRAGHMPTRIWNIYQVLNSVAGLHGLERQKNRKKMAEITKAGKTRTPG